MARYRVGGYNGMDIDEVGNVLWTYVIVFVSDEDWTEVAEFNTYALSVEEVE